ncbi:hypothetical protein [Bradyrhizobium sp. 25ACV]
MAEPETFEKVWDLYIPPIKARVSSRATEIAKVHERNEIDAQDAFDALREYIPGTPVPPATPAPREGWFNRTFVGFTAVVALMTLAFGILGAIGLATGGNAEKATAGFLEIAKIFAGAVIGGAVGATTARK